MLHKKTNYKEIKSKEIYTTMNRENQVIDSNVLVGQKIVMIALAYLDVTIYAVILFLLTQLFETFTQLNEVVLIFGISAMISIMISTIIIKQHLTHRKSFVKTLIYLAIAHLPSLLGFAISLILIT